MGNTTSMLEFESPWRKVTWGKEKKDSLKEVIKNIQPSISNLKCLRVVVVGPCGSGKSSFINSVNNAFQGRITSRALSECIGDKSFTIEYKAYKIEAGNSNLSIVLNDFICLETETMSGCHRDDIIKAINGFMKNGYVFNPQKPISPEDPDYNKDPDLSDEAFCLVYVLAADRIMFQDNRDLEKFRQVRLEVRSLDLPQVIVLTNVDQICLLVKNDLRKVYLSKKIRQKMEWCSYVVGVPMCHVFPVRNYHEEIETNDDMDVLILQAITQIIQLANDNVKMRSEKQQQQQQPK